MIANHIISLPQYSLCWAHHLPKEMPVRLQYFLVTNIGDGFSKSMVQK
jgi:hypothetical protein